MINQNLFTILQSEFFVQYYNKFKWLYEFIITYKDAIFQSIAIAVSFAILIVFIIVKKIAKSTLKKYLNLIKIFCYIDPLYKESILIITLATFSFILTYFQISQNFIIFTIQIIIASIISKIINIISKNVIKYGLLLNFLLIFIVIDSINSPLHARVLSDIVIFSNVSLKDCIRCILSIISSIFIFKEVQLIIKSKISKSNMDQNIQFFANNIAKTIIIFLLSIFILKSINIDLKVLTVFTGAIGLGLGLSIQKFFSRIANGIMIILDKKMKIGDWVDIDLVSGIVSDISTKYVSLKTFNGAEVTLPAEKVLLSNIVNHTKNSDGRVEILFNITINSDFNLALKIIETACKESKFLIHKDRVHSIIQDVSLHGITLKAGFWVKEYHQNCIVAKHDALYNILTQFKINNIELSQSKL